MTNRYRRRALGALCAATASLASLRSLARPLSPALAKPPDHHNPADGRAFTQPLRLPGDTGLMAEVRLSGPIELTAKVDVVPLFLGRATPLWNYAGSIDGRSVMNPLLLVRRGDMLDVTLDNRLGQDTTIHWHGLAVDEANDGGGLHPVRHGTSYRYRFRVDNRAGLHWYHAHPHFHTGEQVHQGLAGLLLIDDDDERAVRTQLDLPWAQRDIPLLIADKQLARKNGLAYKPGADDWIGNRVVVNWVPEPYLDVIPALYRFRIANVSNARMFRLAIMLRGKPLPFWLIGTDGGLLERPWRIADAFLAPAQRLDVLIDLAGIAAGERVRLCSLAYDPMENDAAAAGEDAMLEHPGAIPMGDALDLMELRVGRGAPIRTKIPMRLAVVPAKKIDGATTRTFHLHISSDGRWKINDWNFLLDGHRPVFAVKRGACEIWEFRNAFRSMPHPIHVHGFQFRVMQRSKSPAQIRASAIAKDGLTPHDLGLLDTVVVWPGEIVRLLIDFAQPFAGKQHYMLHCHNLEHEDQGMMAVFSVED